MMILSEKKVATYLHDTPLFTNQHQRHVGCVLISRVKTEKRRRKIIGKISADRSQKRL